MDIFDTLFEAKTEGRCLAKQGLCPTIYKRGTDEYILVSCREMPPEGAWPFLKWVGISLETRLDDESEWVPIMAPLDSLVSAQVASSLFYLLGHTPIIVEYRDRGTFDIFLREEHVPPDCWIVTESSDVDFEMHPSRFIDDDSDELDVLIQFS